MTWPFSKKPATPSTNVPEMAFTIESTRDRWWFIHAESLRMVIDDTDSLLRFRDAAIAKQAADAAANLADAAVDAFDARWGGPR